VPVIGPQTRILCCGGQFCEAALPIQLVAGSKVMGGSIRLVALPKNFHLSASVASGRVAVAQEGLALVHDLKGVAQVLAFEP